MFIACISRWSAGSRGRLLTVFVTLAMLLPGWVQSAYGQPCIPGRGEVVVFDEPGFGGACSVLGAGYYTDPAAMNFPNDAASSIQIGPDAAGFLCQATNFRLECERFTESAALLAGTRVGDNVTSSAWVLAGETNCQPGQGEVSFFRHANFQGFCTTLGPGYYFDPAEMNFLNDTLSSVRLGPGATVELFAGTLSHGSGSYLLHSDPNLSDNPIGNDTMSAAVVYKGSQDCYAGPDQVALFAHGGYSGPCSVLDAGLYRTPLHTGLPNDSISSIKLGPGASAYTCRDSELKGVCEGFAASDPGLGDNTVGNDHISSLVVSPLQQLGYIEKWASSNMTASPNYQPGPIIGRARDVVVILFDPRRPGHLRGSSSAIYNALIDNRDSVARYFASTSNQATTINLVGFFGWIDAPAAKQGNFYWTYNDPADADGDGFTTGHTLRWTDAVTELGRHFDFSRFDRNRDGKIERHELAIVVFTPGNDPSGVRRRLFGNQVRETPLRLHGVDLAEVTEIHPGAVPNRSLIAHEVAHAAYDLSDMYFRTWTPGVGDVEWYHPYEARSYSIMGAEGSYAHIDPVTKLKLGWAVPRIVTGSGYYPLPTIVDSGQVLVLFDPSHGYDEYFVLENRWPSPNFDSNLRDHGVAVWHVIEDNGTNTTLPMPPGVPPADWTNAQPLDWPRRAIRMIRAGGLNPPNLANDALALWDRNTGWQNLTWSDGNASGFAFRVISNPVPPPPTESTEIVVQISMP